MNEKNNKAIIWDWNGTLLDDIEISVRCINNMLEKRNLPILTIPKYREVFTFPVKEYYAEVGFDFEKEDWEKVSLEFINSYYEMSNVCKLFSNSVSVLKYFKEKGFKNILISAMQNDALIKMIKDYGIYNYFEYVSGIKDHYAVEKKSIVDIYLKEFSSIDAENHTFIGDTLHDASIAKSLGLKAILFSQGHQSHQRLSKSGFKIIDNLEDLKNYL